MLIFKTDSNDKSYDDPLERELEATNKLSSPNSLDYTDPLVSNPDPLPDEYKALSSILGLTTEYIKKKENFQEIVDSISTTESEKFEKLSKPIKHKIRYISSIVTETIEEEKRSTIKIRTLDVIKNPEKAAKVIHERSIITINKMANGLTEFKMAPERVDLAKKHHIGKIEFEDEEGKIKETFDKSSFKLEAFTLEEIDTLSKRTLIFVALSYAIQNAELKRIEKEKAQEEKNRCEHGFLEKQVQHQIISQEATASQTTHISDSDKRDLKVKMEVIFNKFLDMLEDSRQATERRIREKLQEYREDLRRFIEKDNLMSDIKQEDINKHINNKDNLKLKLKKVFLNFFQ